MMKENWDRALAHIFQEEGGLVDDPHDSGGLTKYGITAPALTAFRGHDVRRADLMALTKGEAGAIYKARYWAPIAGDDLPSGIDLFLFDFAVNSGPSRAIKSLQTVLGVKPDGSIGDVTRTALAARDPREVISALHDHRLAFLRSLSSWRYFGRGWSRRVARARKAALALVVLPSVSQPSQKRTLPMTNAFETTKTILQSRTVWANTIGLFSLGLSALGYGTLDVGGLTDALLQTVTAGSFVASTFFRVLANKKIAMNG